MGLFRENPCSKKKKKGHYPSVHTVSIKAGYIITQHIHTFCLLKDI